VAGRRRRGHAHDRALGAESAFLPARPAVAQAADSNADKPISINMQNTPIQAVLKALFNSVGANYSIDADVSGNVNITMNNDLGGLLFNGQKRPNRNGSVEGVIASGNFDPNADRYLDAAAWSDPGPLQFGNAPKRDTTVRSFPIYSEDLNVFKVFALPNGHKMRFESMFGNIFNRTLFGEPNTNWSAPSFGQVFTQANSPRSIQIALRYDF